LVYADRCFLLQKKEYNHHQDHLMACFNFLLQSQEKESQLNCLNQKMLHLLELYFGVELEVLVLCFHQMLQRDSKIKFVLFEDYNLHQDPLKDYHRHLINHLNFTEQVMEHPIGQPIKDLDFEAL